MPFPLLAFPHLTAPQFMHPPDHPHTYHPSHRIYIVIITHTLYLQYLKQFPQPINTSSYLSLLKLWKQITNHHPLFLSLSFPTFGCPLRPTNTFCYTLTCFPPLAHQPPSPPYRNTGQNHIRSTARSHRPTHFGPRTCRRKWCLGVSLAT